MKSSCKGCEKRVPGCHGSCEEYKAFRQQQDEINKKRQAANEINEGLKMAWRRKRHDI